MKLGSRLFLAFFLLVGVGLVALLNTAQNQIRPAVRQASEQALVDTANLLAEIAVEQFDEGFAPDSAFANAVRRYKQRYINAQIFSQLKDTPDFSVYITDIHGRVIYHTDPAELGKDYAWWRDVNRTLQGKYGARTTRGDPDSEWSSVMYVAAPIYKLGELVGVLAVSQPNTSIQPFLNVAVQQLWKQASLIMLAALVLGAALSYWLANSIRKLVAYVEALRQGSKVAAPELRVKELDRLALATRAMYEEIEDKAYVENYIHTLAHEMKSPLSAVRGAAEILQDFPHPPEASRFLENIDQESRRMQTLIDRLLSLASVEKQQQLQDIESIDFGDVLNEVLDSKLVAIQKKALVLELVPRDTAIRVRGDSFLLKQALSNLLDNAIEFSPLGGTVRLACDQESATVSLTVENSGQIPDYALEHVFERFYSLPRPDTQRKSTGLGLSFVREVAALHGGSIALFNRDSGIVVARLTLPF
jgi:two-component system, OmpR family, sensor histidine kinase CreC